MSTNFTIPADDRRTSAKWSVSIALVDFDSSENLQLFETVKNPAEIHALMSVPIIINVSAMHKTNVIGSCKIADKLCGIPVIVAITPENNVVGMSLCPFNLSLPGFASRQNYLDFRQYTRYMFAALGIGN